MYAAAPPLSPSITWIPRVSIALLLALALLIVAGCHFGPTPAPKVTVDLHQHMLPDTFRAPTLPHTAPMPLPEQLTAPLPVVPSDPPAVAADPFLTPPVFGAESTPSTFKSDPRPVPDSQSAGETVAQTEPAAAEEDDDEPQIAAVSPVVFPSRPTHFESYADQEPKLGPPVPIMPRATPASTSPPASSPVPVPEESLEAIDEAEQAPEPKRHSFPWGVLVPAAAVAVVWAVNRFNPGVLNGPAKAETRPGTAAGRTVANINPISRPGG